MKCDEQPKIPQRIFRSAPTSLEVAKAIFVFDIDRDFVFRVKALSVGKFLFEHRDQRHR